MDARVASVGIPALWGVSARGSDVSEVLRPIGLDGRSGGAPTRFGPARHSNLRRGPLLASGPQQAFMMYMDPMGLRTDHCFARMALVQMGRLCIVAGVSHTLLV